MCGIAGILTTRPDWDMGSALGQMLRALRHRGPDDEGSGQVTLPGGFRLGLAHTRLSILDLSPAGHQPMADPDSGSWITFNGEVYNHQELRPALSNRHYFSTSDTETILKGWVERGERVLGDLRGMFAFALLDGRRRQLWLVRDRVGIKPLYASRVAPDTWVFASEVRAVLASGMVARRLRAEAVESYLAFGAIAAPWTLIEGVESLLPGECWRFDLDQPGQLPGPVRSRYWLPPFAASPPAVSREEAVERLRPVLEKAAALRMVSDVPVGVFLSGGIDSGAAVALLAHQGYPLHTFSVVFGERPFDESAHSRLVADHFGTKHTELLLRPDDVLAELDRALDSYDQPSIDGLNTYFISQATRRAGVKVALSGLGGDELFAGYSYFRTQERLERPLTRRLAHGLHRALRWWAPGASRTTKLGAVLRAGHDRLARYLVCRMVLGRERRAALLAGPRYRGELLPEVVHAQLDGAGRDLGPVNAQSLFELSLYLANMLLRDTDQMSMAHALEVREPLLDHVLVETAAALPGSLKTAPGLRSRLKGLLVDALPAPLPAGLLNRPKMGFVFPWERWLRRELRPRLGELFADAAALQASGLEPAAVRRLWNDYLADRPGIRYSDVFCMANLANWARLHRLQPGGEDGDGTGTEALAAGVARGAG
jgi:asparagine synthase (glutamine-hydrolysing)